ncbi:uncharacterized protein LOC120335724 isoform X1 [Styela clava]
MEPVAIARITDQGKFIVDNDKLVEIFGSLKDKDLSIISVAGSYRTGKSFMLNFFIRYLREHGWENSNWLGSDDKKLQDGFDWKRGSHPHRNGINVWPEIFDVPLENGKKISVMIVYTQGLFDNNNTPDTNAKIMSISTLLCSHQILNIQNRLQERDLEHLQLSVEYACVAVGLQEGRDERGKQKTTFQKLTFLIRDWVNDDEYQYGNGGDEYLDRILKVKSKSKTVNQVKESGHRAFNEVKGFLMPPPGKGVYKGEKSTLTNADIKPIFREYTMQLTETALHPRNLISKQMFGKPISASALTNLLAAVSKSFRDRKLPEIGTMLENTVRAYNDEAVQRAVRRYKEVMTELVHEEIADTDVLREFHDNAVGEATITFYEISTLGEESDRDKAHQHAIKECEDYYRIVEQENETRKSNSKVIEEINNLSSATETQYIETMREHDLTKLSKKDLERINKTLSDSIVLEFDRQTKDWIRVMPSVIKNKRKDLEQRLSTNYKIFEKRRLYAEEKKELEKRIDKLNINEKASDVLSKFQETFSQNTVRANNDEAVQRAVRRYKEVMTEIVHEEIADTDVLREFHDNAVGEATITFYEISTLGEESDRDKAHQHAIKECEDYYRIVEQENETRKSKVIEEINNLSSAMVTQYIGTMGEHDLTKLSKKDLERINKTLSDSILLEFDRQTKDWLRVMPSVIKNKRKALEQRLSTNYKIFEKRRLYAEEKKELEKRIDKLSINEKASDVLSKFQETFSQYANEYCMDIENLQKTEYKKGLRQYDSLTRKYDDVATVKNTREKLSRNMEQYFTDHVKRFNENNKRDLGLKYEQHVEIAVNEYDRLMKQITSDGKWEMNNDFIRKHKGYKEEAAKGFNRLIANLNPSLPHEDVQEYRQKLDDKIKKRFNGIHKQSNDNNRHLQEVKEQMDKLGINQEASEVMTKFQEAFSQYEDEYCMDIESLRKTEYKKCLEQFDAEIAKYDDYATVKNTREKLSTNMEQYFTENVKRVNENNKRHLGLKYEQHVENAVNEYDRLMKQITSDGKWGKNIDFIQKHDEYRKKAAEDFNRLITNLSPSLPSEDVQEYRQKLDNKMEERFNSIHKQSNDNNIHLQEVKEQMDKLGINQEASQVMTKFQEAFSQYGDEYCMDIESLRKSEYEKCLEEYDTEIAKYDDYATVKNTREKLSTNMEQYFTENVKRVNENNKRDLGLKYEQHVENAVDEYDQMMRQITSDGKWEKNIDFIQKHNEYREKAAEDFNRLIANISPSLPHEDVQEYRQKLDKKMEARFNSIHKQSNDNNIHLQEVKEHMDKLGINQEASEVMTKFQEAFSQYGDEYCMDIESLRKTEYEKCLEEYDTEIAKYDDYATVKNTREKLSTNMEQYFTENVKRVNENNKRDLGLKYEQHVENAVNEYDQLMRQITSDDKWEKNNDFIQKHNEYREKAAKDFNGLIANINPSLPSENVQEYRQKLDNKMEERFNSIYKQSNDNNIHLQEMRKTMISGQFVQEALDIYETEMNKLLINGASCDNLQAENSKFQKMAKDKFKELCSSINCDTAKDLEKLVSLMNNRFEIFKTINKNNEDADFEKKKRRETKKVVKDYCDSMEMHISQYSSPPSDTNLMKKHTALKENAFTSFERASGSDNITKDNKEELGQEIENKFSIFKSKNKTEQARVQLEKQEHETNKSQVKTARSEAYNLFVNKMRNHTQRYDSTIQNLCNQHKITAMEMFDRKTNLLKTKMSAIVQQERNNLSNEIEDNIKIVNEENKVRRNFLILVVLVFALGLINVFEVFNFCFG